MHPGKPNQKAFIERFNLTYRKEMLNANLFGALDDVCAITEKQLRTYKKQRPRAMHLGECLRAYFRSG